MIIVVLGWITTILCLLGTVLNIKKLHYCFYLWIVGNILWLSIDIYNGLWSRAILDIVQLGLAIWGVIEWKRKVKENE